MAVALPLPSIAALLIKFGEVEIEGLGTLTLHDENSVDVDFYLAGVLRREIEKQHRRQGDTDGPGENS